MGLGADVADMAIQVGGNDQSTYRFLVAIVKKSLAFCLWWGEHLVQHFYVCGFESRSPDLRFS